MMKIFSNTKCAKKTIFCKTCYIFPQNGGTMKKVIALKLYIGNNVLVYERRLMVKVWSMTKFLC